MNNQLSQGFAAGAYGAIILVIIMYIMKAAGMGEPGFVSMYQAALALTLQQTNFLAPLFSLSVAVYGGCFMHCW